VRIESSAKPTSLPTAEGSSTVLAKNGAISRVWSALPSGQSSPRNRSQASASEGRTARMLTTKWLAFASGIVLANTVAASHKFQAWCAALPRARGD
jgi:hypothetical protein